MGAGADPGFFKKGGTTHCFFRTAASLESPQKADERGGGGDSDTFFSRAPPASKVAQRAGCAPPPPKSATVWEYDVPFFMGHPVLYFCDLAHGGLQRFRKCEQHKKHRDYLL